MTESSPHQKRRALLAELEDLEALFTDASIEATFASQPETSLSDEVPILRDVVLGDSIDQLTGKTKKLSSLRLDKEAISASKNPEEVSSNRSNRSPGYSPAAQSHSSSSEDIPFLPKIDSITGEAPVLEPQRFLSQATADRPQVSQRPKVPTPIQSSDESLSVADDEIDEILNDVLHEVMPLIEAKLRKKLRHRLKQMMVGSANAV